LVKCKKLNKFSTKFEDDNLLLNIDGVVQGEVKKLLLATRSRKEVQVKQKKRYCEFWRMEMAQIHKYTCCKSKFAISKQKEM
jgi:hypothetical protein